MYTESVSLTFETDPAMNVIELVEHIKRKKKKYIKLDIFFLFHGLRNEQKYSNVFLRHVFCRMNVIDINF